MYSDFIQKQFLLPISCRQKIIEANYLSAVDYGDMIYRPPKMQFSPHITGRITVFFIKRGLMKIHFQWKTPAFVFIFF